MSPHPHFSHPKYRPDIDGLRAVAVLAVVCFHAFPSWIRGGFVGVDVFFVISGFLISTIIFENLDKGTFSFAEFYARRIKRILPALLLVLIVSYVLGWFALLADEYKQLGKHIVAGTGFVSNIVLWREAGYFDNSAETKPLLHLWSLGIEEQFYFVWPVLLWLAWKRRLNLLTITLVITVMSFWLNFSGVKKDLVATFYLPQTRFWELLCGSFLAWVNLYKREVHSKLALKVDWWLASAIYQESQENDGKTLSNTLSLFGLLLLLIGFFRISKDLSFPGGWALVPVFGSALIILAGPKAWINRILLSNKMAVWFGLISFPLYLWHWPLLSFSRIIQGEVPSLAVRIVAVLLSVFLAWLTYKFIERPIRLGGRSQIKVFILLLLMAVVGYLGYSTYKLDGIKFRTIAVQSNDFLYRSEVEGFVECNIKQLKENGVTLNYCLSSPNKEPNAAIIGDSHAEDKFHGLVEVDKNSNWMLIGNSSCPPVLGILVEGDQKGCKEKFESIFKYLADKNGIENVVLSFWGGYFKTDFYAADHVKSGSIKNTFKISTSSDFPASRDEIFLAGLDAAVKFLIANGKKVTVLIDIPELPFLPKDCFRSSFKQCEVSRGEVMARQEDLRKLIARLKSLNPQLVIFDPIDIFCSDTSCSYKKDSAIVYRDSHHLTLRGSKIYAEIFSSKP